VLYLAEGGQETELMYKHGHELPEFAMYPLLGLRPNASAKDKMALCQIGHLEAGNPEDLGARIAAIVRRLPQIDVVGGCCGTWDDHLPAIAGRLQRPEPAIVT